MLLLFLLTRTLSHEFHFTPFLPLNDDSLDLQVEFHEPNQADVIHESLRPLLAALEGVEEIALISFQAGEGSARIHLQLDTSETKERIQHLIKVQRPRSGLSIIDTGQLSDDTSIKLRLYGPDPELLKKTTEELSAYILSTDERLSIFSPLARGASAYRLHFEGGSFGVPTAKPSHQLSMLLSPLPTAKLRGDSPQDLVLRPRYSPVDFEKYLASFLIDGPNGEIALSEISRLRISKEIERLDRKNGALYREISILPTNSDQLPVLVERLEQAVGTYPLPDSYHFELAPIFRRNQNESKKVVFGMICGAALILLLLRGYYKNWTDSLFCFFHIPPVLLFCFFIVAQSGRMLSIPLLSALVLTLGLSINNIVVLLPPATSRSTDGDVLPTFAERLPSLRASSFTTIAGVMPLLAGSGTGEGLPVGLSIVITAGTLGAYLLLFLSSSFRGYKNLPPSYCLLPPRKARMRS